MSPTRRPGARWRGYTLVEVLVVILVTAILVGLVVPRLGRSPAADPDYQLERLAALLHEWCDRAVIQGRELGVRIEPNGFGFRVPAEGETGWVPPPPDGPFRPRSWAQTLRPRLLIEGRPVPLDDEGPQVACHPSGEMTPFELRIGVAERGAHLRASFDGNLRVEAD